MSREAAKSAGKSAGNSATSDDDLASGTAARRVRRSLAVVLAGLVIQLIATISWTPGSFVIAATFGAPIVVIGVLLFIRAVLKVMARKGAL